MTINAKDCFKTTAFDENGSYSACILLSEGYGKCSLGGMDCRQCNVPLMPEKVRMIWDGM